MVGTEIMRSGSSALFLDFKTISRYILWWYWLIWNTFRYAHATRTTPSSCTFIKPYIRRAFIRRKKGFFCLVRYWCRPKGSELIDFGPSFETISPIDNRVKLDDVDMRTNDVVIGCELLIRHNGGYATIPFFACQFEVKFSPTVFRYCCSGTIMTHYNEKCCWCKFDTYDVTICNTKEWWLVK